MTRFRHACASERGWTLIETLLGLVLGLTIAGAALMILESSLHAQKETGSRLAAQSDGTFAMLRITKDVRAATQVYLVNGQTIDLQVPEHDPAGGNPISTHVRYQCAGSPATCTRYECNTPVNSNSCPNPTRTVVLAQQVTNTDNFQGVSMGVNVGPPANTPASPDGTGTASASNLGFVSLHFQIARSDDASAKTWPTGKPLDFVDGADLGNFTN